jgi:hypothetical protein
MDRKPRTDRSPTFCFVGRRSIPVLRPVFAVFSPVQRKGEGRITQRPRILNHLVHVGEQNTRVTEDVSDRNVAFCTLLRHLPIFPRWFARNQESRSREAAGRGNSPEATPKQNIADRCFVLVLFAALRRFTARRIESQHESPPLSQLARLVEVDVSPSEFLRCVRQQHLADSINVQTVRAAIA